MLVQATNSAVSLIYRKNFLLLLLIILCQSVFIFSNFEYPSFYLRNSYRQQDRDEPVACITYDPDERTISTSCEHSSLTDIDNQL